MGKIGKKWGWAFLQPIPTMADIEPPQPQRSAGGQFQPGFTARKSSRKHSGQFKIQWKNPTTFTSQDISTNSCTNDERTQHDGYLSSCTSVQNQNGATDSSSSSTALTRKRGRPKSKKDELGTQSMDVETPKSTIECTYPRRLASSSIYTPTTNISQQHEIPPSTNNNIHKNNTQHNLLSEETEGSRHYQSEIIDDVVAQQHILHRPWLDTDVTTTTSSTPASQLPPQKRRRTSSIGDSVLSSCRGRGVYNGNFGAALSFVGQSLLSTAYALFDMASEPKGGMKSLKRLFLPSHVICSVFPIVVW